MSHYVPSPMAVAALRRLVTSVAGTGPILAEHVDDNDEVLPHLLIADLRRWFVDAVVAGNNRSFTDFLAAIEFLYASEDPDTSNVVGVSFVEDLLAVPDANEQAAIEVIRQLAGPRTLADLTATETYLRTPGNEPRPDV
jgi:hypothetical protein